MRVYNERQRASRKEFPSPDIWDPFTSWGTIYFLQVVGDRVDQVEVAETLALRIGQLEPQLVIAEIRGLV